MSGSSLEINSYWKFFFLTLGWSWILWAICIIFGLSINSTIGMICYILGAVAPSSVGVLLAWFDEDEEYWNDFTNRITKFKLIQRKWYLIIFGLIPFTILVAVLINYFMNNTILSFNFLKNYLMNPLLLVGFAVATIIGGPLFEEVGWRGYALDHLTEKNRLIWSGVIVTLFWMIWHWPLFMIEGTLPSALISESFLPFISYNIEIFSYGIIIVWIYDNTNKSILSAMLFHFSINFFNGITNLPTGIKHFETIIQLIIAIFILIHWKNRKKSLKSQK